MDATENATYQFNLFQFIFIRIKIKIDYTKVNQCEINKFLSRNTYMNFIDIMASIKTNFFYRKENVSCFSL